MAVRASRDSGVHGDNLEVDDSLGADRWIGLIVNLSSLQFCIMNQTVTKMSMLVCMVCSSHGRASGDGRQKERLPLHDEWVSLALLKHRSD